MKRLIAFVLAAACILALASCVNKQDSSANAGDLAVNSGGQVPDFGSNGPSEPVTQEEDDSEIEHSFLATVIEETTTYMVVEPSAEEEERGRADKIRIDYGMDHVDYLYGKGRKVVIYYYGDIESGDPAAITTNDISTEGFREFKLSVTPSESKEKIKIIDNGEIQGEGHDYDLYYYGLDVQITVDNQTIPLDEALIRGKITLNGIISKANEDVRNGVIEELICKDGGSQVYQYEDYTMIKYHTLDGNRDVYIGTTDMDTNIAAK